MKKYKYALKLDGIHCQVCVSKISRSLEDLNVGAYRVDLNSKTLYINYDNLKEVEKRLNAVGVKVLKTELNVKDNILVKNIVFIALTILLIILFLKLTTKMNLSNDSSLFIIFLFGLINSLHCVSMCTPLYMSALSINKQNRFATYQFLGGKIISYSLAGLVLGLTGSIFTLNTSLMGIFMLSVGFLMILFVASQLGIIKYKVHKKVKIFKHLSPFKIGLTNALIPCGLLTVIYLIALSKANVVSSVLVMFTFALATSVPFLFVGLLKNRVNKNLSAYFQKFAMIMILVIGVTTISSGYQYLASNSNPQSSVEHDNYVTLKIDGTYDFGKPIISSDANEIYVQFDIKSINSCIDRATIVTPSNKEYDVDFRKKPDGIMLPLEDGEYTIKCWMNMVNDSFSYQKEKE